MMTRTTTVSRAGALALAGWFVIGAACGDDGVSRPDTAADSGVFWSDSSLLLDSAVGSSDSIELPDGSATVDAPTDGSTDSTSTGTEDAPAPDADGFAGDAPTSQDSAVSDAPALLASPVLDEPGGQSQSFGLIQVRGQAEAAALVHVSVLLGLAEIGRSAVLADSAGQFALTVSYRGAADGETLSLQVRQTLGRQTSEATVLSLTHRATRQLGGTVFPPSGTFMAGQTLYVRAYLDRGSREANELGLLDYVAEQRIDPVGGEISQTFSFEVAPGDYLLRAFIDRNGENGLPDGEPSLPSDPQGALAVVLGDSDSTGSVITLRDRADSQAGYGALDARTINESPRAEPPIRWTEQTGPQIGEGLCGGFYLLLSAHRHGPDGDALSPVRARLADARTVELLDDGGCGESTRDNRRFSYDRESDDGSVSYGIADPGAERAGIYSFFYSQRDADGAGTDFVHIQHDSVAAITRLPFGRQIVAPDPTHVVRELRPTIQWTAVAGATAYEVQLRANDGAYENGSDEGRAVTTPLYQPSGSLSDQRCYRMRVVAFDASPRTGDVDAESSGADHMFCVDVDGDKIITVSGTITNTAMQAPFIVTARSDDRQGNHEARASFPLGSSRAYSLELLAGDAEDGGRVEVFVDLDDTGSDDSPRNERHGQQREGLDLRASLEHVDLTIHPGAVIVSPVSWARDVDVVPVFGWENYRTTVGDSAPELIASQRFSYGLWIDDESSDGLPGTILGVAPDQNEADLASLSGASLPLVDIAALASCLTAAGVFSLAADKTPSCSQAGMQPSRLQLQPGAWYQWGLVVVLCDPAQLSLPATFDQQAESGNDPFLSCLADVLFNGQPYADAGEHRFRTLAP